jgi:hypothetical protein
MSGAHHMQKRTHLGIFCIRYKEGLQRQANESVFGPLLVELHPALSGKFRIIDGERR